MSLADQIIEHGPYHDADSLPIQVQTADNADINQLRDELIAARALKELLGQFHLEIDFWNDDALLRCRTCGANGFVSGDESPLAELVRWATEHAEVCR